MSTSTSTSTITNGSSLSTNYASDDSYLDHSISDVGNINNKDKEKVKSFVFQQTSSFHDSKKRLREKEDKENLLHFKSTKEDISAEVAQSALDYIFSSSIVLQNSKHTSLNSVSDQKSDTPPNDMDNNGHYSSKALLDSMQKGDYYQVLMTFNLFMIESDKKQQKNSINSIKALTESHNKILQEQLDKKLDQIKEQEKQIAEQKNMMLNLVFSEFSLLS